MKQLILVFLGGGLGSIFRYLIAKIIPNENPGFPWGTLTINLLGCFLLGLIIGYTLRLSIESKSDLILFLSVGVCGGFTTFSAFAFENYTLIRLDNYLNSFLYIGLSLFLGIIMVYLGFLFEKLLYLKI